MNEYLPDIVPVIIEITPYLEDSLRNNFSNIETNNEIILNILISHYEENNKFMEIPLFVKIYDLMEKVYINGWNREYMPLIREIYSLIDYEIKVRTEIYNELI